MTICYVDVDEDSDLVWYAFEESGGYKGLYDTLWCPCGVFEGKAEAGAVVDENESALLSILGF